MKGLVQGGVATAILAATIGTAQSAPVFQGRLADGSASSTCTVSGVTKCTMFYNTTLDITILNDWNIGRGYWDSSAGEESARVMAELAGASATGLTGWVLPTGDGDSSAGADNQYLSIWIDVGSTSAGLRAQFDGLQSCCYWSGTEYLGDVLNHAWYFNTGSGRQGVGEQQDALFVVAVRPGDVAAPVPEPQTLALALLALGATVVARRRRAR